MKRSFADHATIITGASDGIGAELARQLADEGAWLALAARRAHELDLVAQDCIARGARAIVIPTDVTDPEQCRHLAARTLEAYGRIDTLICNAGLRAHFRFEETADPAVFDQVMRVNYLGSVHSVLATLPALRESRGRIAVLSSLAGKTGVPLRTAYAASKHALHGFFDSLRIEVAEAGISVTLICPGFVNTGGRVEAVGADGEPLDAEKLVRPDAMPAVVCARRALRAIQRRRREVVMTPNAWLMKVMRAIAPRMIDRRAAQTMRSGAS
jgi:short-subunit dehydrogenase